VGETLKHPRYIGGLPATKNVLSTAISNIKKRVQANRSVRLWSSNRRRRSSSRA
jgi:hypothetical protein